MTLSVLWPGNGLLLLLVYPCQVCVFFESLAEHSLGFTYVCVAGVDVTRDVVDGSTLVFFDKYAPIVSKSYLNKPFLEP